MNNLTQKEIDAGTIALKAMVAESIPAWQVHLIPAGMLEKAVTAVVTAVDKVRADA